MRFLIFTLLTILAARAQHAHPGSAGGPVELQKGLGRIHHPIRTTSREAQAFFDQGLMLIYGFNHDEAIRSFRKAAELDPQAVMPLWGMAYAMGPNINRPVDPESAKACWQALQAARRLAPQAPPPERAYVDALAQRYSADPNADFVALARNFATAMKAVMQAYPDDLDAAVLYAEALMNLNPWKLWTKDYQPAPGTLEIVETLERVLRRDPNHIGANHYYIHAVEASARPERALPAADRLGQLAPNAGHLVHMPGHIYIQLGDHQRVVETNREAARVDEAFIARTQAQGEYPLMYYSHNLHFVIVGEAARGNYRAAREYCEKLRRNVEPALTAMPMLESFAIVPLMVDVQFSKWNAVEQWKEPPAGSAWHAFWLYGRGLAASGKGEGRPWLEKLQQARQQLPADAPFGALNTAREVLKVAEDTLAARILEQAGQMDAAIAKWREAVAAEDALSYDEPRPWYGPVRQSLGGALLRAKRPAEAELVFREALELRPRDGRLLFGLWSALNAQGKTAAAALVEREFRAAWTAADTALQVAEL
jgi:tetratricopeptide (TPR) repeat protein